MTTFLPSFCYCLGIFPTTEYHLPLEVHESLNRIFPVFMRVSVDTEISLPRHRAHLFVAHKTPYFTRLYAAFILNLTMFLTQ